VLWGRNHDWVMSLIKVRGKRIYVRFPLHYSRFINLFHFNLFYEIYYTLIYFSGFMGRLKYYRQHSLL
jgi:hypothetical protein